MMKIPLLVGSGGYLSEPSCPSRYIVDGDHYCQSFVRISIDPTLAGKFTPSENVNLFLRMTISLKGGVRAKSDPNIGPDSSETNTPISSQVKCSVMEDVWDVPMNDNFLRAKVRPQSLKEKEILPIVHDRTRSYAWEPVNIPNQPNLKVQLIIDEHDLYYHISETTPFHYIFRLPTEPGKGRSICSDFFLIALPKPARSDFPVRENLLEYLQSAGLYGLTGDQMIKFAYYIGFDWGNQHQPPPQSAELYESLKTYISSFDDPSIHGVLAALSVIRASSMESALVLNLAAHVKELRKSKDSERRYTSNAKLLELPIHSIS
eukprot:TRINITY_DN7553_c0_g1_i1.p1 TRINITY_DN7553_c0_g1~~TRINITY_DN7553_c0_g1_i1.p1  ORF type:complete len:319 (-),score=33.17 TRINITY_DN7553_c0_g1_i1:248-1204(-)